jgi:adenine-specific DNA-methyltransferase
MIPLPQPFAAPVLNRSGTSTPDEFLERIELLRLDASRKLDPGRRADMGQFLTPLPVARMMASLLPMQSRTLCLLDPGAGVGSLCAAAVAAACRQKHGPEEMHVVAYEIDESLVDYLRTTMDECAAACQAAGIRFVADIRVGDFIRAGVELLQGEALFGTTRPEIHAAILNPPYRKIPSDSHMRRLLRTIGIETTNLYAAFLWLTLKILDEGGALVAITPRSFCNGPYFAPFRRFMTRALSIRRVHVFDSRDRAFADDDVLQENIILHGVKGAPKTTVVISASEDAEEDHLSIREVHHDRLVNPKDEKAFIHLESDEFDGLIGEQMRRLPSSLADLEINVSTGRVVEFRAAGLLRDHREGNTAPLIYPVHFRDGFVVWPSGICKKEQAITLDDDARELLVDSDFYVLTKRFSAKEEPRRVVAAVFDPRHFPCERVGFENHVNYFHRRGRGLLPDFAKGLSAFLNSSWVDLYFRQFNGHTQVNAADLRSLRYPAREQLESFGNSIGDVFPEQDELDRRVCEGLFSMARGRRNPVQGKRKIKQALAILKALKVPRAQQNERSALTLLALADMQANTPWSEAGIPLRGITEMMDYFQDHFGKKYAPNTRETVRRFTVHQFVQMGIVLANPDDAQRPVNSPDNRYQLDVAVVKLLRTFGTSEWDDGLTAYLATASAIERLCPQERDMREVPVTLPDGTKLKLSAGGQNPLVKEIVEKFCPRFTPGARLVYVGDTGEKRKYFEEAQLRSLGVTIDEHGKMPDVVVHYTEKNWLVLIEAVTSHGPMNLKRHNELKELFAGSSAGLVYVTAFLTRKALMKYLSDIAWETEVWIAESPTHLIHFNGERFLGPYA